MARDRLKTIKVLDDDHAMITPSPTSTKYSFMLNMPRYQIRLCLRSEVTENQLSQACFRYSEKTGDKFIKCGRGHYKGQPAWLIMRVQAGETFDWDTYLQSGRTEKIEMIHRFKKLKRQEKEDG